MVDEALLSAALGAFLTQSPDRTSIGLRAWARPTPYGIHLCRRLPERILLLGRQTVLFDDAKMRRVLRKFALDAGRFTPEFDVTTVHAKKFPDRRFLTRRTRAAPRNSEHVSLLVLGAEPELVHGLLRRECSSIA